MELLLIVPGLLPGWDTLAGYAPPQQMSQFTA